MAKTDDAITSALAIDNVICSGLRGCPASSIRAGFARANTIGRDVPMTPGLLFKEIEEFKVKISSRRSLGTRDEAIVASMRPTYAGGWVEECLIDEAFRQLDTGSGPGTMPAGIYDDKGYTIFVPMPDVSQPGVPAPEGTTPLPVSPPTVPTTVTPEPPLQPVSPYEGPPAPAAPPRPAEPAKSFWAGKWPWIIGGGLAVAGVTTVVLLRRKKSS